MTRHVILAYGRETEHQRAIFAVLSFWAWYAGKGNEVRTVIFTDRPAAFGPYLAGLPVDYVPLAAEQLEAMRGPQQFVHRVKPVIIAQLFREYPADNVLFCDSDTFFVAEAEQLLQRLQPGVSLMHAREYRLADAEKIYAAFDQASYPRKFVDFIHRQTFRLGGVERQFHQQHFSWNSGVLGITSETAHLLPDICALTDDFYANSGWFTSEQMAFSLSLQLHTRLLPSDQYIFHYWGARQKHLMDGHLSQLLAPGFAARPLAQRLAQVRRLTLKWWRAVELDKSREGALYAFANGEVMAGVKCAVKAFIAAPFNAAFAKDLVGAIARNPRARRVQEQSAPL